MALRRMTFGRQTKLERFMDSNGGAVCILLVAVLSFGILASTFLADEKGAAEHLRIARYQPVRFTGYSFFGCSEDDVWRTKYVAIAPNGQRVKVVVCEGIFKGATIRLMGAE